MAPDPERDIRGDVGADDPLRVGRASCNLSDNPEVSFAGVVSVSSSWGVLVLAPLMGLSESSVDSVSSADSRMDVA